MFTMFAPKDWAAKQVAESSCAAMSEGPLEITPTQDAEQNALEKLGATFALTWFPNVSTN